MNLKQKVDDFVAKYTGKTKGYPTDKDFNGECLSIVKIYIKEVFGINPPPSGSNSAYGYWSNFPDPLGTVFEKIVNTREAIPQVGDMPIWKPIVGNGSGHIDICIDERANEYEFKGFDQNWNGRQGHIVEHNYDNIAGWLRPKVTISEPIMNIDEQNAMTILKKFKSESEKLKDGNLEGAINALVGWAKDAEKLTEVEKNLKNSLKINADLLTKVTALEKLDLLCQAKVKTANEKAENAETLAGSNMKLYKNKNDEFNAVKSMTTQWEYLIKFCVLKFKGLSNEEYLKEELPKVIKSLNKEA